MPQVLWFLAGVAAQAGLCTFMLGTPWAFVRATNGRLPLGAQAIGVLIITGYFVMPVVKELEVGIEEIKRRQGGPLFSRERPTGNQ